MDDNDDKVSAEGAFLQTLTASGSQFGIYGSEERFRVFDGEGNLVKDDLKNKDQALAEIRTQMANRPVLPERWRSEMAYEGVPTDDMRLIEPGAISFRDMPLPLMLQTETELEHFGAILAGSIESAEVQNGVAFGKGTFDESDAGKQALSVIQARGKFGVSVDIGMAEGGINEETGEARFTRAQIMGLTMTPFPAFADAFIELDDPLTATNDDSTVAVAPVASGTTTITASSGTFAGSNAWFGILPPIDNTAVVTKVSDSGCAECDAEAAEVVEIAEAMLASSTILNPPEEWFDDPKFHIGDERLVEQPNGSYACPLTVTEDGQVYGHLAVFRSCHTSYSDRCVPPPKSPSGYAYFTTGTVTTQQGTAVRVGQLTMGAGHASTRPGMSVQQVKDHYDGGPGAIQMADVTVGEDQFGIWFAGALRPNVTSEQIRAFKACGVSGDWREVVRGKGLDLVACAAGIPVPGFPITRAIAASAAADLPEDVSLDLPGAHVGVEDGEVVALVAAGVVRQPMPWERALAHQQAEIEDLKARLTKAERVTNPLAPQAAKAIRDEF